MSNTLNQFNHFYLVGIKGVAMTSIAQCLLDMGKTVEGSDLKEDFVTQDLLSTLHIPISLLNTPLPKEIDCLIYTSAHQGPDNPQVLAAKAAGITCLSQAEALGILFNAKTGIAVCGVGGKSTTSAMITWILEKTGHQPSFSIGVGNIPGLEKTGRWRPDTPYFVAEADEYVIDPHAQAKGEEIVPRFSFLRPYITVCTNLAFDHPDVYRDFAHTQAVYSKFFSQLKPNGTYIFNEANRSVLPDFVTSTGDSFGTEQSATFHYAYMPAQSAEGKSFANLTYTPDSKSYTLELCIPGEFNIANAVAALAGTTTLGVDLEQAIEVLKDFHSTMRRFEYVGEKDGVKYYDDYAHHPSEIKAAIKALSDWYPHQRKIIAFQSHTYSRTKQLFDDFVEALATANEVYLIDIFASARETADPTVSADLLVDAINQKHSASNNQSLVISQQPTSHIPHSNVQNAKTIENLAQLLKETAKPGDVVLTLGAGDIYKVHTMI